MQNDIYPFFISNVLVAVGKMGNTEWSQIEFYNMIKQQFS